MEVNPLPIDSSPATAAEFESYGIDGATAARMAALHEAQMGRGDVLSVEPLSAPAPAPAPMPTDPSAARAKLDQITADRAAGKISDYEWRTTYEPQIMALANNIAPNVRSQQAPVLDAAMAAPNSPWDYRFPQSLEPETDEALVADRALRAAFHAEGLPRHIVESIGSVLANAAARAQETAEEADTRIYATIKKLGEWYGPHTDANLRLLNDLMGSLRARGAEVRAFVDAVG